MQNLCVFEHVIKTLNAMDRISMLRTSPVSVDGSKMKDMNRILREFLRLSVPDLSKSGDLMESYANLNIDFFLLRPFCLTHRISSDCRQTKSIHRNALRYLWIKDIRMHSRRRRTPCLETTNLVGALLYISVNTRPDIAISSSILSHKISQPTEANWTEAKRTMHTYRFQPGIRFTRTAGSIR